MSIQSMKEVGLRIKMLRVKKHMTQATLAEKANISKTYMSNIERGKKQPNFQIMLNITESLEISLSDLLYKKSLFLQEERTDVKGCNQVTLQGEFLGEFIPVLRSEGKFDWKIYLKVQARFASELDDIMEVYISDEYKTELIQRAVCGDCIKIQGRLLSNIHQKQDVDLKYTYRIYAEEIILMIVTRRPK